MWQRYMDGAPNMIRSEIIMRNATIEAFEQLIANFENESHSDTNIKEYKVLENKDNGRLKVIKTRSYIPMMMDRVNIVLATMKKMPNGQTLIIQRTMDHPDFDSTEDMVRMDVFKATLLTQDKHDLHIIEFSQVNMGGYFPARLLNMVMSVSVHKFVKSFYAKI